MKVVFEKLLGTENNAATGEKNKFISDVLENNCVHRRQNLLSIEKRVDYYYFFFY